MPSWKDIRHTRTSGKEYTTCPNCSHERRKNKNDKCLSSDHSTGHFFCSHCGWKGWREDNEKKDDFNMEKEYTQPKFNNKTDLPDNITKWFLDRKINQDTVNHFKVTFNTKESMPCNGKWENREVIMYNYFMNGKLINTKFKTPDKLFKMVSGAQKVPYNIDAIIDSDECLFCEGEEEVLSWKQAGYDYAVSVPNGATVNNNNLDYLAPVWEEFFANKTKIYIATDNDEAGRALGEELIRRFGRDICYTVTYKHKDANDDLKYEGEESLLKLLKSAKAFDLDGVLTLDDEVMGRMLAAFDDPSLVKLGETTYYDSLDPHWTWRRGEVNVLYGPGNMGKSCFAYSLLLLQSIHKGRKWVIFSPEQYPADDFYEDLAHTLIGKTTNANFPAFRMSKDEYIGALRFIKEHFFYIYTDKEAHTPEWVYNKMKQVIIRHGVDGIVIDPFNQLEHDYTKGMDRDDRYLSNFLAITKKMILKHNVFCMIITHGSVRQKKDDDEVLEPNMYKNISLGQMWSNKCDNILAYYRPNFFMDISDSLCCIASQKIKKQKLTGRPGKVDFTFTKKTNRYYDKRGRTPFDKEDRIPAQMTISEDPEQQRIADDFFNVEDPFLN